MSSDIAISSASLSKCYHIYDRPSDRLKQALMPRLQGWLGLPRKTYHSDFWAVREASFEIARGETVGIVGRNGSGKSTLLQMLCGTVSPTAGHIRTQGRIAALLELGAGFNGEFTGRENIYLSAMVLGLTKAEIDQRYSMIVDFAEIGEFIDRPVKTYSSGMFVRLAFAIHANIDPDILVVDEALAVGDSYFIHKCMHRFHYLQKRGTTILLVTHDATAIKTLCSRAIWLNQGQVAAIGPASRVVDQYLSAVNKQPVLVDFGQSPSNDAAPAQAASPSDSGGERHIPNIDRRTGTQECRFVGIGLYDRHLCAAKTLSNDSPATVRATLRNDRLPEGSLLVFGLSLRNHRGVDIASNNSEIERFAIPAPAPGDHLTLRATLQIPELHPGSYALNVSLGFRGEDGNMRSLDGITNAVAFDLIANRPVHVLMSLKTEFEIEGYDAE